MDNLLTPDFGLTFWTLVTFLGLVLILGKYAWKPMIKALEDREQGIRRSIEEAATSQRTAEELTQRLERELAASQQKAHAMLEEARKDALELRAQLLKKAEEDAQRLLEQNRVQIKIEKENLSRELRHEVGVLSVRVAEKLLRHSMNAEENEKLVQTLLSDLEKDSPKVN